ncbi:MAG: RodZ domain-containing protein [Sideroxydans sp.]
MDTVPETSPTAEATVASSVGSVLRTAREAQGLTVADIAERIKFSVKQVEALESDNHSMLPQGTFLRGFVRSYARTLNVDAAPLLAMMAPSNEIHGDISEVQTGGLEFMSMQDSSKKNLYLLAAALLVAMLLALFIWNQKDETIAEKVVLQDVKLPEGLPASAVLSASSGVVAASAVVVADVKLVQEAPALKAVEPSKVVVFPKTAPLATTPVVAVKPKVVTPTHVVVPPPLVVEKSTLPLDQLKKRPIHIVFAQDSWMEIVDTNGEMLLSRMNVAGTEKWIGGNRRAPYQVAIGKVGAVKLFYKGREVDLSKYNQSGVVRLVLE